MKIIFFLPLPLYYLPRCITGEGEIERGCIFLDLPLLAGPLDSRLRGNDRKEN